MTLSWIIIYSCSLLFFRVSSLIWFAPLSAHLLHRRCHLAARLQLPFCVTRGQRVAFFIYFSAHRARAHTYMALAFSSLLSLFKFGDMSWHARLGALVAPDMSRRARLSLHVSAYALILQIITTNKKSHRRTSYVDVLKFYKREGS